MPADPSLPARDFVAFLSELRARIEPLEREMNDAWWQSNTAADEAAEARAAAAQKALTRAYADRTAFADLTRIDPATLTSDEARQRVVLLNSFAGNQLDDTAIEEIVDLERRLETEYNTHRPVLRGEPAPDNRIKEILRDSDDTDLRQEAWEASKKIGERVAADVLRLVTVRNREARRLGYRDHYQMALALQELDEAALFTLLDEVERRTDPAWTVYKGALDADLARQFNVSIADLRPWHYGDPFFQEAPRGDVDLDRFFKDKSIEELTRSFFTAIGLDIADILGRSDLYEREGKSQHAFCLHVGRFEDVRVLCNLTGSERWMGTMLHEFGHAVYDKYLGADLPFFLRDCAHTLTTEAIAMLFGRLSRNAAWLSRYAGVSREEAETVAASAAHEQRAQLLILARWCLVMCHFERALYAADPTQNLDQLWWDLVRRFQGMTPPDTLPQGGWASKLHLALAPVYYQNYLLGEMFASQLLDYLRETVLGGGGEADDEALVSSPRVGEYLQQAIFAPGQQRRWDALIEQATGEALSPARFVAHLDERA